MAPWEKAAENVKAEQPLAVRFLLSWDKRGLDLVQGVVVGTQDAQKDTNQSPKTPQDAQDVQGRCLRLEEAPRCVLDACDAL